MKFGYCMSNINYISIMNDYSIQPVIDSELYGVEEIRHLYDLFDVSFSANNITSILTMLFLL